MPCHDSLFKKLFSAPELVRDLARGFLPGALKGLDLSSLEKLATEFVSDKFHRRAADTVWRFRLHGQWMYLYLLLEFQRRVDPLMALRMGSYVPLLYQSLIEQRKILRGEPLPPIVPVVLYNGNKPWTARTQLSDLLAPVDDDLRQFLPSLRHLVIDMSEPALADATQGPNLLSSVGHRPPRCGHRIDARRDPLDDPAAHRQP